MLRSIQLRHFYKWTVTTGFQQLQLFSKSRFHLSKLISQLSLIYNKHQPKACIQSPALISNYMLQSFLNHLHSCIFKLVKFLIL